MCKSRCLRVENVVHRKKEKLEDNGKGQQMELCVWGGRAALGGGGSDGDIEGVEGGATGIRLGRPPVMPLN